MSQNSKIVTLYHRLFQAQMRNDWIDATKLQALIELEEKKEASMKEHFYEPAS